MLCKNRANFYQHYFLLEGIYIASGDVGFSFFLLLEQTIQKNPKQNTSCLVSFISNELRFIFEAWPMCVQYFCVLFCTHPPPHWWRWWRWWAQAPRLRWSSQPWLRTEHVNLPGNTPSPAWCVWMKWRRYQSPPPSLGWWHHQALRGR